jgi:hypothetical protein
MMFRFDITLLILSLPVYGLAQGSNAMPVMEEGTTIEKTAWSELPDSPGALHGVFKASGYLRGDEIVSTDIHKQSRAPATDSATEPYHWKGLLLQSFAFNMMQNATRIITADQNDRHLLLNKPYWSDYWASLQQFNMHRWNDGDSIKVNYIGHPMEGAIAGYIEVQNDPRGRELRFSRNRDYWNSRFRAFLWETVYSTYWETGPTGETAIFNQGGFTYPIGCKKNDLACEATAKYTNNTGWVDFVITPIIGTLWLLGEDTIDRYVSDPLVERHPNAFGIKLVRASLNPPASLANILRGHFPWWRDYEHPNASESFLIGQFEHAVDAEQTERGDLYLHYRTLSLGTNDSHCLDCRNSTSGAGLELGVAVRRYLDVMADVGVQPNASPVSSLNVGGSLTTANFGVRSGYSGERFAVKVSLAPGFASYSRTQPTATESDPNPGLRRNFNFSTVATLSGDARFTDHLAFRLALEQMLIRYKSTVRDPPGIGIPPRLSFLSHENYINSTNWGVSVGPVLRF